MAADRKNIIIGPGRVYLTRMLNEPLPNESSVEFGAAWVGNWGDPVGLLMRGSGVTMRHSVTMHASKAEEYVMAVKRTPTDREISFAFTVLEYSIANLQLVFPGSVLVNTVAASNQKAFSNFKIGVGQDNPSYCIGIEAFRFDGSAKQPVRWRVYEASIEPDGETMFGQGGESLIPIVCHALYEDSYNHVAELDYVTGAAA